MLMTVSNQRLVTAHRLALDLLWLITFAVGFCYYLGQALAATDTALSEPKGYTHQARLVAMTDHELRRLCQFRRINCAVAGQPMSKAALIRALTT